MRLTKVAAMLLACAEGTQLNIESESEMNSHMHHGHGIDKLEAI